MSSSPELPQAYAPTASSIRTGLSPLRDARDTQTCSTSYNFVATDPPASTILNNFLASNLKIAAKSNQPNSNSVKLVAKFYQSNPDPTTTDDMSYNYAFKEPNVNVAYADTSSDLNFETAAFLKDGVDMPLYQEYSETQHNGAHYNDTDFNESDFFAVMNKFNDTHPQTISPQQLDLSAPFPPSAVISELSFNGSDVLFSPEGPGNMDAPLFGNNSTDPSPVLADNMAPSGPEKWYPLFPSNEPTVFPSNEATLFPTNEPVAPAEVSTLTVPTGADLRERVVASPPRVSAAARPAGVRKNKSKPLAPIVVNENDSAAAKRARNTLAARKSRGKKADYVDSLEDEIRELRLLLAASEQENAQLKAQINPPQIVDDLNNYLSNL
ncbi:hypothetical protein E4T47_02721 [Aureobasidium subglaciale]|nr:hypothetical protein E4T47_02721 [Aureobasidium subglaciale]